MSIIRIGTIVAIVGIVAIALGAGAFFVDQASYKSPLDIAPYPSATPWGLPQIITPTQRNIYFQIPGVEASEVASYYQQKLDEHYGQNVNNPDRERCVRIPAEGVFEDSLTSNEIVPYQYVCVFGRFGFNSSQQTTVYIQPGLHNDDPLKNTEGMVPWFNMSKSGSPSESDLEAESADIETSTASEAQQPAPRQRREAPSVVVLGLVAVALVLALYVGTQVIGVLYNIIVPPLPPLPEGITQLDYTNTSYGVDTWVYGTDQNACELVRFYEDNGASCRVSAFWCLDERDTSSFQTNGQGQNVAQCVGSMDFSLFVMRWNATIATNYLRDGITHFNLSREILWGGVSPTSTPAP